MLYKAVVCSLKFGINSSTKVNTRIILRDIDFSSSITDVADRNERKVIIDIIDAILSEIKM